MSTLKTTVSASLGTPGVASASYNNTVASQPPEGFYVVIGRGAASAVNLATLLQSPAAAPRLAHPKEPAERLKIHLVGLPDPWETYHAHGMGQPPHLLCLPGFAKKPMPGARTIRSGMHSQDFSAITHEQMDAMIKQAKITTHTAWVPIIQPQLPGGGGAVIKPELLDKLEKEGLVVGSLKGLLALDYPVGFPAYRLVLVNPTGECSLLYAHKIDICTGVGRPQNEVALRTTDEALSRLWRPPYDWDDGTKNRVMVTGPEALCISTRWKPTDRICVFGAGGIGLNMVERAEDVGCYLDWYPNTLPGNGNRAPATSLHRSFNLPRNDTVLKTAKSIGNPGRTMNPDESGVRDAKLLPTKLNVPLYPASQRWRFANGTLLEKVTGTGNPKDGAVVEAKSGDPVNAATTMDYDENSTAITTKGFPYSGWYSGAHAKITGDHADTTHFDRVFFCVGFDNAAELGVPKTMVDETMVELEAFGRHVGMQTADNRIRVLGAAATMYPGRPARVTAGSPTDEFFAWLPYSAVLPGFIYAGVTIAEANGWFDDAHPNTNINTMPALELSKHLLAKGLGTLAASQVSDALITARRMKNGFADLNDLNAKVVDSNNTPGSVTFVAPGWQVHLAGLTFDYGPPLAWT